MILFLLSLMSCHKPLNHITAKQYFSAERCVETLEYHLKLVGCEKIQTQSDGPFHVLIRCHKKDSERGEFWDNYVFRISPAALRYEEEIQKEVDEYTICLDPQIRLEAFPPY